MGQIIEVRAHEENTAPVFVSLGKGGVEHQLAPGEDHTFSGNVTVADLFVRSVDDKQRIAWTEHPAG